MKNTLKVPVLCDACRMHRLRPTKIDPKPGIQAVKRLTFGGINQNVCQRHFEYFDKFMEERSEHFSWESLEKDSKS